MDKEVYYTFWTALGIIMLCGGYIKVKTAFVDAVRSATQSLVSSIDKLSLVVDNLCKEMETQRATIHSLELQVQTNTTNIDNQHRRLKTIEEHCRKIEGSGC